MNHPEPLSAPSLPQPVQDALQRGNLVEAIKLMRADTGMGLKETKDALEAYMRGEAPAAGFAPKALPAGAPLPAQVQEALDQGNKIEAVRRLRGLTGMGLKEAKDAVEAGGTGPDASEEGLSPGQVRGSNGLWWWFAALAVLALAAFALLGCATRPPVPVAELAPSGRLKAAINFGNPILAVRMPDGSPRGVSVDLSNELGRRLGVPVELVTFTSAGKVVEAVRDAQVDIAFVAIDPVRGADMLQTPPYVIIEGAYLVRNDSPIRRNEEVDQAANRVVVGNGSAYDLYLSRELKAARLVKAPTSPAVTDVMVAQNLEVAAGVKQQLEADAKRVAGLRLLPGRFMVINQAMGLPKGREAGARYLAAFVEEMKASGFVAAALTRHGIEGAAVAPPSSTP
ncbi:periplasmic component of amino acid ABC-type transporter/signal transduction system [Polaromonas sp. CF318]|nr:periplasmic component of amino acid ABC-type transporter/signal transduction system [Polaromonas sp. CF318]